MTRAVVAFSVAVLLAGCASSGAPGGSRVTPLPTIPATAAGPSSVSPVQTPAALPTSSIPVRTQQLALSGALSGQIGIAEVFRCGATPDHSFSLNLSSIHLGQHNVSVSITAAGYQPGSPIPLAHAQGTILEYGSDQQAHFYQLADGTLIIGGNGEHGSIDADFRGAESTAATLHLSGTWTCA
jgi:hypothetical protein